MSDVKVTKRGADRVRGGHLWIYRSDVSDPPVGAQASLPAGGSVVRVSDPHDNFVGQAFFSDRSEIAVRLLTQAEETIDREWWRRRIREAADRRERIVSGTNAYRLVSSEGDLLPSLIVDVYDDVFVLQTLSQGTESIKAMLVELLVEGFAPRAVVERNDMRVRQLEGLGMIAGTL